MSMEGPPKITKQEVKETKEPTRDEVIEGLRQNPEDKKLLNEYLDKREDEVKNSKDALKLTIEVAEIYRDSGMKEAAHAAYQDAAEHAWQEHEDELYKKLITELEKLS